MEKYLREPLNSLTHLIGAFLSLIALILMLEKALALNSSTLSLVSVTIFGVSLILLYSTSSIYHLIIGNPKVIAFFRRLDHSMIFILICGSYMPFYLILLQGKDRIILTTIIITLTIAGILFKMFWFNCPRWLSTALYIGMGWIALFSFPLYKVISLYAFLWLLLGGIFYTIGGIIYGLKPKTLKLGRFGHHEIFHIFIIVGSLCHFISVFYYVLI
ncbi:MAG: hemolysin III family protein [Sarcina ventriculi]|uniref:Hemolysin n=1 Tax=Sarcina ventriculi TaxID=1267 RepID=A0ABP2ASG9_SARVE|nr:hemolysin III family protein [Sarcina ventriculi]MDO4402723.1 hemolysin III family protein [Clostridiaceae bacterium]MBU5322288.1 hemolysin III family protein [Sarcina ventriculi]MCI5637474.1 hemolysin III family protein [Sarcina ventriculi]MDD7374155.1 hemolysin III family protein [Sarcina ventriculi]MDY7062554.1 hemolysin III family protein [Sarcina ventriculi]